MNLIFLHIPKTAGSTYLDIINRNYESAKLFQIDGLRPEISFKALDSLPKNKRNQLEMICGHRTLNVHKGFEQKFRYVTFLRNPIDQYISNYHYIRRTKEHNFFSIVSEMNSIEEFIDFSYKYDWNNIQTRHLSGSATNMSLENVKFSLHGDENLRIAKNNLLELIDYVFLTEKFEESLVVAKHEFNWKNIYFEPRNVTKGRTKIEEYSPNIIDKIAQLQKYDIQLYDVALKKYNELKSNMVIDFAAELEYLNVENHKFRRRQEFVKRIKDFRKFMTFR
jgi:hypothetical protein